MQKADVAKQHYISNYTNEPILVVGNKSEVESMALFKSLKNKVYSYCKNHLPDKNWYDGEFAFIEDDAIRKRIIEEFKVYRQSESL